MLHIASTPMLSFVRAATVAFALLSVSVVHAVESRAAIESPSGLLRVELSVDGDGRPGYTVERNGKAVIEASRLGFLLADVPKLERNFAIESQATRSNDDTWELPWGERRYVRNHDNELRVRLKEKVQAQRALDVVFRVYDDG